MPVENVARDEGRVAMDEKQEARLDNPIWSALTTDHAHFSLGGEWARRYPAEIGPLSGMPEQTDAGYAAMRPLTEPGGMVGLFLQEAPRPPAGWTLVRGGLLDQMVAQRPALKTADLPDGAEMRRLTPDDAAEMVALAELTEPGPFRLRTIELGMFFGVVQAGRLVAMAGQRLRVPGFVELSAVCTHPEARGRGYARLLMSRVMEEIVGEGRTPFLHSFTDNFGAIRVYQDLGFVRRRSFELAVVQREEGLDVQR